MGVTRKNAGQVFLSNLFSSTVRRDHKKGFTSQSLTRL